MAARPSRTDLVRAVELIDSARNLCQEHRSRLEQLIHLFEQPLLTRAPEEQ
jgi:hypothetical protein